jgi:hypothetical protein
MARPEEETAMRYRALSLFFLAGFTLSGPGRTEAAPLTAALSFDSTSYQVKGNQSTFVVQVFLTQLTGTPFSTDPVGGASFQVFFNNPSGIAAVTSTSNIAGNTTAFDPQFITPIVSATSATLGEVAISNPGLSASPGLLGTFTFNALRSGTTTIMVAAVTPSPSFSTIGGATFQPTSATATITVLPEPASVVMMLTGAPLLMAAAALRRRWSRSRTRPAVTIEAP